MRTLANLVLVPFLVLPLLTSLGLAQHSAGTKRVLVLHWYDRSYPGNSTFDQEFQAALRASAPGGIEYYSEYLETNRFPGENQSRLLSDYLQQKYSRSGIDVVVARASPPLDFLLKHRTRLFPNTPIVFLTERLPPPDISKSVATGLYINNYRETVEMALRLHPGTNRIFVVTGTLTGDKTFETIARAELQSYREKIRITYLTDLTLEELKRTMKNLPKKSIVLYGWQQVLDQQGKVAESADILSLLVREATVPIYGMSQVLLGRGMVGGYVWTYETMTARLAEIALRVANGVKPSEIPIAKAPAVPIFDWRQLERWGIRESLLPPNSEIRFRELSFWQLYKWRIVAAFAVFLLQALLIGALLVAQHQSRHTQEELGQYKQDLENLVEQRTTQLVAARDEALAADRAKTVFLANMSHELRTPLNAILGFSGMVLRDGGLSDQHRKYLTIVGSSGELLLGLIDDVLDTAKIEAGSAVVEATSVDLHALISDTMNMLRENAQAKTLQLLRDISPQTPRYVRSDFAKLRQVLTNLVGNAVKYTDEGSVTVRVDARPGDNSGDVVLCFEIVDTGQGIAEEDLERIFDPFVQAGTARTKKGAGLGLSITRHFVQLLGGTIQVESTLGWGSRFRVELPAQTAESHEVETGNPGAEQVDRLQPGQPEYRILIVEDAKENCLLLQQMIETVGFKVQVVEDGRQAVEAFTAWRPHFIWMDLLLPVLDGKEATRRIRRLEGGADVKIVAVTASSFASQRTQLLKAGFDDFLRKPYRHREIFDCMGRHLGVRYRYHTDSKAVDPPVTLSPTDLAALPMELRDELESAVESLDTKRVALLIGRVSEQNPALGSLLGGLAERFAYTAIHDALQRGRQFTEANR